jgi:hypothetical protein
MGVSFQVTTTFWCLNPHIDMLLSLGLKKIGITSINGVNVQVVDFCKPNKGVKSFARRQQLSN